LRRLWLIEAAKYNVLPLDDRSFERFNPDIAGRPQLIRGNTQLLYSGMRLTENCVLTLKNKSHSVTAEVTVPESGAAGVIITQGGSVGGWSLYAHEGRLKYCYNFFGIEYYIVTADEPIPTVSTSCGWSSPMTGASSAKAATSRSNTTAKPSAPAGWTEPMAFSADEACDVGSDTGSPASTDYGPTGNKFSGTKWHMTRDEANPSILFIFMDNLGYGEVGCYGGTHTSSTKFIEIHNPANGAGGLTASLSTHQAHPRRLRDRVGGDEGGGHWGR
jgi:hypothetical protein